MVKSQSIISALILSLCLFITPNPCLSADDAAEYTDNTSYLLRIFEGKYLDLSERVSRGELPADTLAKANTIRTHLKKTVIKHNFEMEMLKVDILDGTREESTAAFDKIQILVNETEQNKVHYLQKLTQLISPKTSEEAAAVLPSKEVPTADYFETGQTKQVITVVKTVEVKSEAKRAKSKEKKENIWETKDYNLRMALDPADNTKGDLQ